MREILNYLDSRAGLYAWRNNTGAVKVEGRWVRFGCPGSPDILAVQAGGRMVGVEVKAALGSQSAGQKAWQRRIERLGGLYILARSVDDVRAALDGVQ
jgi:hypothetical protein